MFLSLHICLYHSVLLLVSQFVFFSKYNYHECKIAIITSNTFNFDFIPMTSRCSAIQGDMYSCQKLQGIC